jgi:hypothetical protein
MKNYLEVIAWTHFQLDMGQKAVVQFSAWTRNILFTDRSEVSPADSTYDSADTGHNVPRQSWLQREVIQLQPSTAEEKSHFRCLLVFMA